MTITKPGTCLKQCVERVLGVEDAPNFVESEDWVGALVEYLETIGCGVVVEPVSYSPKSIDDDSEESPMVFELPPGDVEWPSDAVAVHAFQGKRCGHAVVWEINPPVQFDIEDGAPVLEGKIARFIFDPSKPNKQSCDKNILWSQQIAFNHFVYSDHGPVTAWLRFWRRK